jgi:hypothetical protein
MKSKTTNKKDQDNETILKKKTNQDFNNQKPDPKDPIQEVAHQIGEKEEEEFKKKEVISESDGIGSEPITNQQNDDMLDKGKDEYPLNFEEENKNVDNNLSMSAEYSGHSENQDFSSERD